MWCRGKLEPCTTLVSVIYCGQAYSGCLLASERCQGGGGTLVPSPAQGALSGVAAGSCSVAGTGSVLENALVGEGRGFGNSAYVFGHMGRGPSLVGGGVGSGLGL